MIMKNSRKVLSAILSMAMVASLASCSLFDKAGEECQAVGDEFIETALSFDDVEDLADFVIEDDEDFEDWDVPNLDADEECVSEILAASSFEADKKSIDCSTKDEEGTITYIVTMPDYDAIMDEDPEDADEFIDMIEDCEDVIEVEVTLEFELEDEEWRVSNVEDALTDLYDDLFSSDVSFLPSFAQAIDYLDWYYGGDNSTCLELDIWKTDEGYEVDFSDCTFELYNQNGGNLIYSDYVYDGGSFTEAKVYADDVASQLTLEEGNYFPADTYRIAYLDPNGGFICDDTVVVTYTDYGSNTYNDTYFQADDLAPYVDYTSWWYCDSDTIYIELDIWKTSDGYNCDFSGCTFELYNEGGANLIYTGGVDDYSGYTEATCYYEDSSIYDSNEWYFPTDTYRVVIYAPNGDVLADETIDVTRN